MKNMLKNLKKCNKFLSKLLKESSAFPFQQTATKTDEISEGKSEINEAN